MASPRLIVAIFMEKSTNQLIALRDQAFTASTTGQGVLVRSQVNGSSFEFAVPSVLTPLEIAEYAQLALDHKAAGITRPASRTTARFF